MNEKELRDLIKSQLKNVINEAKGLKLKVEVPMRDPEIKKFIHNYLLLNKKYSMHRMPEYSMKFGILIGESYVRTSLFVSVIFSYG